MKKNKMMNNEMTDELTDVLEDILEDVDLWENGDLGEDENYIEVSTFGLVKDKE